MNQLGLQFEVIPSEVKESIRNGEGPIEHVLRLAEQKALDVGKKEKDAIVIGADTIVLLSGEILGKPVQEQKAYQMLMKLSGKEHRVITGFCIFNTHTKVSIKEYVKTRVTIKDLSDEDIRGYIQTKEPFDKAGAYAVQGIGAFMVKEIKGSYSNVVGLPICELIEALSRLGAVKLFEPPNLQQG